MKIDHIALITTDPDPGFHNQKRKDIARAIQVQPHDITIYHSDRHPEGTMRGCFESHHHVWQQCVKYGYQNTLIFEDDVVFLKPVPATLYADFLHTHPDWEIFYLGHRPIIWDTRLVRKTDTPGFVEVRTNDTHAYLIKLEVATKLAAIPWENSHVDIFLRERTSTSYAKFPMRAIQNGRFLTNSFFNGLSERNSQYIRYALQKPLNPFRALGYLVGMIVVQPWLFATSTWFCFTRKHPR
jgi:GR25 family glycosyltransferase involved in LPS biosynthesis